MPAISRLIAVAPRGDVLESLRFAFERDGTEISHHQGTDSPARIADMLAARDGDQTVRGHDVMIVNSSSTDQATDLLRALRAVIKNAPVRMPIVYLGNELSVEAGIAAGANAVLSQPLFLRDVVVATGLVARRRRADLARGDLKDFKGLFYIVRALTQFKRSAVLTVVRGLRRGEIRFFEGQATSAQTGVLHGLSALHHLMLWQVGTFELRFESVVQRQQIPLATDDLLSDVRRFLAEVQETAQSLSFSGSYETIARQVEQVVIPGEIGEVLDLMDGSRTLPDIVEDSPFRMFETLRIANRLLDHQLIRHVAEISSDFGFKMRRRVEEMVLNPESAIPVAVTGDVTGRTVKLNRDHVPESETPEPSSEGKRELDWSGVMPASPSTDDKLAQVVPAAVAAGEITIAEDARVDRTPDAARQQPRTDPDSASVSADKPRPEQLETFTSVEERDQMFALGDGPSGDRQSKQGQDAEAAPPNDSEPNDSEPGARTAAQTAERPDADDETARIPRDDFSDDEEAFFQAGRDIEKRKPGKADSFEDLDEGYRPVSLWQRLFRRRAGQSSSARDADRSNADTAADAATDTAEGEAPAPDASAQAQPATTAAEEVGATEDEH